MVSGGALATRQLLCCSCVVYDSGSLFTPEVLDVTEEAILKKFTVVCKILLLDVWSEEIM